MLWGGPLLPVPPRVEAILRVGILTAVIVLIARPALSFRVEHLFGTLAIGTLVFFLWILPDQLIAGYRDSVLFQNGITGRVESSMTVEMRRDSVVVGLRFVRAAMIVPIVEELFWRGWMPRWIDRMDDFRAVQLGRYTAFSFGATAILFALEHGPFWDVGLVAGLIYNGWMLRTRSLGDLILCHAVTNALLSGWVLLGGQWQYW